MNTMSKELRRLQAAQREHARLQRSQQHTAQQINALKNELQNLKRDKVSAFLRYILLTIFLTYSVVAISKYVEVCLFVPYIVRDIIFLISEYNYLM